MEKNEVLEKVQQKKPVLGEMEKSKLDKSNWIAVFGTFFVAIAFIIAFCCINQKECAFAIGSICFTWASIFYFCQYFIAKRPWQVLIGAVLECIGACIMITNFILTVLGVI